MLGCRTRTEGVRVKQDEMADGGVFRIEQMPNSTEYTIRAKGGELAVRVEINGNMFPARWHKAMLADLERRWVHRVRPPRSLRLVSGGGREQPQSLIRIPDDDPYLLGLQSESPD